MGAVPTFSDVFLASWTPLQSRFCVSVVGLWSPEWAQGVTKEWHHGLDHALKSTYYRLINRHFFREAIFLTLYCSTAPFRKKEASIWERMQNTVRDFKQNAHIGLCSNARQPVPDTPVSGESLTRKSPSPRLCLQGRAMDLVFSLHYVSDLRVVSHVKVLQQWVLEHRNQHGP